MSDLRVFSLIFFVQPSFLLFGDTNRVSLKSLLKSVISAILAAKHRFAPPLTQPTSLARGGVLRYFYLSQFC